MQKRILNTEKYDIIVKKEKRRNRDEETRKK